MNPNKENVMHVSKKNAIIQNGCAILMSTKKLAVISMITPMIKDFVAAAPT